MPFVLTVACIVLALFTDHKRLQAQRRSVSVSLRQGIATDGSHQMVCSYISQSNIFSSILVLFLILFLALAEDAASTADDSIVCICKCCYMGDCAPLANASWSVGSCGQCLTSRCNEFIKSPTTRQKVSRTFETLEEGVPEGARIESGVDVCEVVSVLEAATCKSKFCKRSTNLKAECFDRNEPLHKYIVMFFTLFAMFGVGFAFIKNHLPALQGFNLKYFNY